MGPHGDDPTFALIEYAAPEGCAVDDREAWKVANPALGDFLYEDGMATEARTVRESAFRQFRLGQWPTGPGAHGWPPSCGRHARTRVGSRTAPPSCSPSMDRSRRTRRHSSHARSATCTHLDVVGLWEAPNPADESWRVDVLDVEDTIRQACRRWRVREVTADPFRWQRSLAVLADERITVTEYPQSPSRMTPACSQFYEAVINEAGDVFDAVKDKKYKNATEDSFKTNALWAEVEAKLKSYSIGTGEPWTLSGNS